MRVAIVGPRDLNLAFEDITYAIYCSPFSPTHLVTGCAKGVDKCVREYAKLFFPNDWTYFKANWEEYGKVAGNKRNRKLVREGRVDGMIAFVRKDHLVTSGTASGIAEAVAYGVPVFVMEV